MPVAPPELRQPEPSQPVTGGGGWVEKPSDQEMPEVRITDTTGMPSIMILRRENARYRWMINPSVRETVEPGTYEYSLWAPERFRPDVVGTLRCRKYRIYELKIFWRKGSGTLRQDLGDAD